MELALGLGTVDTIGRAHQDGRRVKHKTKEARPTECSTRYHDDSIPADDLEQPMSVGTRERGRKEMQPQLVISLILYMDYHDIAFIFLYLVSYFTYFSTNS